MKITKPFIITSSILCVVTAAAALICIIQPKAPAPPVPLVESSPTPAEDQPPDITSPPEPLQPSLAADSADQSTQAPSPISSARTALNQVDNILTSRQTRVGDKLALLKQLKDAGQLDQAIADLTQLAANDPNNTEIPIALGEALLSKFPVQDYAQAVTLGQQIDKSLDAALALDPTNWEAQFYKADSMSYWPSEAGKGPEVIERLSTLVNQQETMPPQPQFAQTYELLGDQYQKAGQPADAQLTWQRGLAKFPTDSVLQAKLTSTPRQ
jgi:tetratricopeptide (TPR) repeat protein